MDYKLVAIGKKEDRCHELLICRTVNEKEFNKLKNEAVAYEQEQAKEKSEFLDVIASMKNEIEELKKEIAILKGEN
jgi:esterase/lipase